MNEPVLFETLFEVFAFLQKEYTLSMVLLDKETSILVERLNRNWVWWKDDAEVDIWRQQLAIVADCDVLIKRVSLSSEYNNKTIEFMSIFYYNEKSMIPWFNPESRNLAIKYVDEYHKTNSNELENIIITKLQNTLMDIKTLNLGSSTNESGYKLTSRIKIREKLIGQNYTQTLDKMEAFKAKHLLSIGYLSVLITHTNVKENWRFILPVLLSFLDDTDFMVKREACNSLNMICDKLLLEGSESNIIRQSQTLILFKNAIQPLLLALPSLTPESKSIIILPIAYDTIFKLFKLSIFDDLEYYANMSALLNDIILPSIGKCKDYINVLYKLLEILQQFISECGQFSIVLSKPIIYTLLTVLMDPYIAHASSIVTKCIDVLQFSISKINEGRRNKYKFDVMACMGTLKRRIPEQQMTVELSDKIQSLQNAVDI